MWNYPASPQETEGMSQMKITWGNHRMPYLVFLVVLEVLTATTGSVLKVFEEKTHSPKVSTTFNNCKIPDAKLGSIPIAPVSNPTPKCGWFEGSRKETSKL